jgi:hypothetical protein
VANLILPTKHAFDGAEAFFEDRSIEQRFAASLGGFPASGIDFDARNHPTIENSLSIEPAIVDAVQAHNRPIKLKAN